MAGNWWRLLAAFVLILIAGLVRGQESAADRTPPPSEPQPLLLAQPSLTNSIASRALVLPGIALPGVPINPYSPAPGPIGLPDIVHPAGMIFSGTVTAISHGSSGKHSVTAITFKVDTAFRGVSRGQALTIHEWAGLWNHGERYRVGERVFLFLYSPSRLGLTSPVAGGMGRFLVDSSGRILLSPQHLQLLARDPILGGRAMLSYDDLARAIQRASE